MQKGNLEPLLKKAKDLEKKCNWLQAVGFYKKASDLVFEDKNILKIVEIQEKIGYCYYRAALQAKTNQIFRSRIKKTKQTYEKILGILPKSNKPKINHIKALVVFTGSHLELDLSKKRKMLDIWWNLEKEAIKLFEEAGDFYSSGKICNILIEYSHFDRVHLVLNWADQREMLEEVICLGEKAIKTFSEIDDQTELARAYCWTVWYYARAIHEGLDLDRRGEFGKKGQEYSKKALDISKRIGDPWLIGWSNNAASFIEFSYTMNLISAIDLNANFRKQGKVAQDNMMLFIGRWWAGLCISYNALNVLEDPNKQRLGFEKAIKFHQKAIMHGKIIDAYSVVILVNSTLCANYSYFASITPNLETKKSLYKQAAKKAREYFNPKYSFGLYYWSVLTQLSNALYNLSKMEDKITEKNSFLQRASQIISDELDFVEQKLPENLDGLSYSHRTNSLIYYELAIIEKDREKSIEFLKSAILSREICVKISTEFLKEEFLPCKAGLNGNNNYWLGNYLNQMYTQTKDKKNLHRAITSYSDAAKVFAKINLNSRVAESYWRKANSLDLLSEQLSAAKDYGSASEAYLEAAKKILQLKEFYNNHSKYMLAWNQIEQARYFHSIEKYEEAQQHYEKAAKLHESTDSWKYLSSDYFAWANMEKAESLSRKDNAQQAKETFQKALKQFTKAANSIKQKMGGIASAEEKELNQRLLQGSDLRRKYCQVRIQIEEAKLLDRGGKYLQSSKSYGEAAQNILAIVEKVESEAERKEMEYLAILCQAWEKMAVAEETTSSESYLEAARLFEQAKEYCYTKKASLWALGNSNFCRGLAAGVEYQTMLDVEDHNKAKGYIQNAATNYSKAGYEYASEYAKATLRLFDAYLFMNQAERESDTEKRVKQYQLAENLLQLASGSFMEARQPEKTTQVKQILENVREEKELAISFNEVLQAPLIASTTQSFAAPSPTSEVSVGLEQFQHANVQANLIAGLQNVKVGESFCLSIEFVNAGKEPALLTRVEDFVPLDFTVVKKPEIYRLEDTCLNMKGKQIAPLKLVEAKLVLQPSKKGVYQLKPTVHYLDEVGQNKSLQLKSVEIRVEEVILADRVSTGTKELDSLLLGGIPKEYAVVLTGPPSDERELLIKNFLEAGTKEGQTSFYVTTEAVGLENILDKSGFYLFLCNPKPKVDVPDLPNVYKLRGKNLTNLNIALLKAYRNVVQSPGKRIAVGIVSDVLVDYGLKTTRQWITELTTDLVSKGFTVLAVINPGMHPSDQAVGVTDLFDGEISLYQTEDPLECKKTIRIKKLRGQDYINNPICLTKS